jgi:hypothetical protein
MLDHANEILATLVFGHNLATSVSAMGSNGAPLLLRLFHLRQPPPADLFLSFPPPPALLLLLHPLLDFEPTSALGEKERERDREREREKERERERESERESGRRAAGP